MSGASSDPASAASSAALRGRRERAWQRGAFALGLAASVGAHALLFLVAGPGDPLPEPVRRTEPRVVVLPPHEEARVRPPAPEVSLPSPPGPIPRPAEPVASPRTVPDGASEPVWIPHDVPPRLLNPEEIRSLLADRELEGASGTERVAVLWLYVDRSGTVRKLQLRRSSGSARLDRLVQRAGRAMEFSPALNRGRTVGVWISQPVRFSFTGRAAESGPDPVGTSREGRR